MNIKCNELKSDLDSEYIVQRENNIHVVCQYTARTTWYLTFKFKTLDRYRISDILDIVMLHYTVPFETINKRIDVYLSIQTRPLMLIY